MNYISSIEREARACLRQAFENNAINDSTITEISHDVAFEPTSLEVAEVLLSDEGDPLLDFVPEEAGVLVGSSLREVVARFLAMRIERHLSFQLSSWQSDVNAME